MFEALLALEFTAAVRVSFRGTYCIQELVCRKYFHVRISFNFINFVNCH